MTTPRPSRDDAETTHERPSSFREMLYRDRRIVSRRKMDRRLRDRAAERREVEEVDHTYFPALSRMFNKDAQAQWRAVIVIVSLTVGAFLFGRWVG